MTQAPTALPLVFSFAQPIVGNGFMAGVQVNGRALLEEEEGESWITAVCPVGFAGGGADRSIAFQEFRNAWMGAIFDIAAESNSFAAFKDACETFLGSQQDSISALWKAAVEAVRSGKCQDPSLPRQSADTPVSFIVVDLTSAQSASANTVETGLQVAA